VLSIVGEVGERRLVDVEHPDLLAIAGELQALGVGDGLVDDGLGVAAVLPAEHVVADVLLAAGRDRFPVAQGVRLHSEPPAIAWHAAEPAQVAAGMQQRPQHVDQRHAVVDLRRQHAGGGAGGESRQDDGEDSGKELCHRQTYYACVGGRVKS